MRVVGNLKLWMILSIESGVQEGWCSMKEMAIELAKHAIGLDYKKPYRRHGKKFYKPYRNYYATILRDPVWRALVSEGFATCFPEGEDRAIFTLTRSGLDWLGRHIGVKIYDEQK